MVLGLGITRLLSALVEVFRSRETVKLDWVPLVWAGCIFLWQLQYWWAIIELPGLVNSWTPGAFVVLVSLPLFLFVSAALVLPPSKEGGTRTLRESFARDGRWALVSMSAYFGLALFCQLVALGGLSRFLVGSLSVPPYHSSPRERVGSPSRRVQEVITVLFVPLTTGRRGRSPDPPTRAPA
jgi:hypothetical protein